MNNKITKVYFVDFKKRQLKKIQVIDHNKKEVTTVNPQYELYVEQESRWERLRKLLCG